MRKIPNQSEKRFVSPLMKKGQKSIRLNLINSETSMRMNPNQYETPFNSDQSELGFIQIEFSIRINPNNSDIGFIRID